jgi:tight adherence protein B
MTLLLGCTLGLGLVLALSPVLWPAGAMRSAPGHGGFVVRLHDRLAQAGLHSVTVPLLAVVSAMVGVACAAVTLAVVPVAALGATAGLIGLALPLMAVTRRARRRRQRTRGSWPDALDHLVSAVRSGLSLPDSVSTLAHVGPDATRADFAAFEHQYAATGNFAISLDALKSRLADPVADRILETLRMSREVGGNELTTVLRNLMFSLRQEAAIRAEVEARQSWVVNAARLGVAAPWIVLLLLSTRPEAAAAYNSSAGVMVIVAGLLVSLVAYRVMLSLGRLPEERRWFQ